VSISLIQQFNSGFKFEGRCKKLLVYGLTETSVKFQTISFQYQLPSAEQKWPEIGGQAFLWMCDSWVFEIYSLVYWNSMTNSRQQWIKRQISIKELLSLLSFLTYHNIICGGAIAFYKPFYYVFDLVLAYIVSSRLKYDKIKYALKFWIT
jgi:hypothetical protein